MSGAVLVVRPRADTVAQDRPEAVVLGAGDVRADVEHDAGHLLAHGLPHEPRLARVNLEALLQRDAADSDVEAALASLQFSVPGKNQVVGVARVRGAGRRGETAEAAIEAIRTQVRQGGRGRRSLREVREPETLPCLPAYRPALVRPSLQHLVGDTIGTQAGEQAGDGNGEARRPEQGVDARGADRREEVAQIEAQYDGTATVR